MQATESFGRRREHEAQQNGDGYWNEHVPAEIKPGNNRNADYDCIRRLRSPTQIGARTTEGVSELGPFTLNFRHGSLQMKNRRTNIRQGRAVTR